MRFLQNTLAVSSSQYVLKVSQSAKIPGGCREHSVTRCRASFQTFSTVVEYLHPRFSGKPQVPILLEIVTSVRTHHSFAPIKVAQCGNDSKEVCVYVRHITKTFAWTKFWCGVVFIYWFVRCYANRVVNWDARVLFFFGINIPPRKRPRQNLAVPSLNACDPVLDTTSRTTERYLPLSNTRSCGLSELMPSSHLYSAHW